MPEWLVYTLIIVFFPLVPIGLITLIARGLREEKRRWRGLAEALGLSLRPFDRPRVGAFEDMVGHYRGCPVVLRLDKRAREFVCVKTRWERPMPEGFSVQKSYSLDKLFSRQDIEVEGQGDTSEFDRACTVQGRSEDAVKAVLTPRVRAALLNALKVGRFGGADEEGVFSEGVNVRNIDEIRSALDAQREVWVALHGEPPSA